MFPTRPRWQTARENATRSSAIPLRRQRRRRRRRRRQPPRSRQSRRNALADRPWSCGTTKVCWHGSTARNLPQNQQQRTSRSRPQPAGRAPTRLCSAVPHRHPPTNRHHARPRCLLHPFRDHHSSTLHRHPHHPRLRLLLSIVQSHPAHTNRNRRSSRKSNLVHGNLAILNQDAE